MKLDGLDTSLLIVFITILFVYIYTGKVKKATPVDAIRNGQTGERYKSKTLYQLKTSHLKLNLYMALNDVLSAPKRTLKRHCSSCLKQNPPTRFRLPSLQALQMLTELHFINTMKAQWIFYMK